MLNHKMAFFLSISLPPLRCRAGVAFQLALLDPDYPSHSPLQIPPTGLATMAPSSPHHGRSIPKRLEDPKCQNMTGHCQRWQTVTHPRTDKPLKKSKTSEPPFSLSEAIFIIKRLTTLSCRLFLFSEPVLSSAGKPTAIGPAAMKTDSRSSTPTHGLIM